MDKNKEPMGCQSMLLLIFIVIGAIGGIALFVFMFVDPISYIASEGASASSASSLWASLVIAIIIFAFIVWLWKQK